MKIIDMHVHAFPDSLAPKAMKSLMETTKGITACTDGTIGELLRSMDNAGISSSWVMNIATKGDHFRPILNWCREIADPRILPFPSLLPTAPEAADQVDKIADAGFPGIKIHPVYQGFTLDDSEILPFYRQVEKRGLILVCHTGFYLSFPREPVGNARRVRTVLDACPDLLFITTHFGGWNNWDEAEEYIVGKPIYMDVSYSVPFLERERARDILLRHPREYILFGSDSPWEDQEVAVAKLRSIKLPAELEKEVFSQNGEALLKKTGIAGKGFLSFQ